YPSSPRRLTGRGGERQAFVFSLLSLGERRAGEVRGPAAGGPLESWKQQDRRLRNPPGTNFVRIYSAAVGIRPRAAFFPGGSTLDEGPRHRPRRHPRHRREHAPEPG